VSIHHIGRRCNGLTPVTFARRSKSSRLRGELIVQFTGTADRSNLLRIAEAEGRLLTAPTIGESLQKAGRKMLVVSSGSSGSALLNNHTVSGGAILHYQYVLPEQLSEDLKTIGPAPAADEPPGHPQRIAL
jgi:hypothetical protein